MVNTFDAEGVIAENNNEKTEKLQYRSGEVLVLYCGVFFYITNEIQYILKLLFNGESLPK